MLPPAGKTGGNVGHFEIGRIGWGTRKEVFFPMARRINRTYRPAAVAAAHTRVIAARQELLSAQQVPPSPEEEPMHRYSHPIPRAVLQVPSVPAAGATGGDSATATQVLEQLSCQSQLLVDLLGAVNSLTAALLAQNGKS